MKLEGKAKSEFEKWFKDNYEHTMLLWGEYVENTGFYELTESMRYSVYVDWFDSVDIDITVRKRNGEFDYDIKDHLNSGLLFTDYDWRATRPEARTAAIEKANEIHNNRA